MALGLSTARQAIGLARGPAEPHAYAIFLAPAPTSARNELRANARSGCAAQIPNANRGRIGDAVRVAEQAAVMARRMDREPVGVAHRRRKKHRQPAQHRGDQLRHIAWCLFLPKSLSAAVVLAERGTFSAFLSQHPRYRRRQHSPVTMFGRDERHKIAGQVDHAGRPTDKKIDLSPLARPCSAAIGRTLTTALRLGVDLRRMTKRETTAEQHAIRPVIARRTAPRPAKHSAKPHPNTSVRIARLSDSKVQF